MLEIYKSQGDQQSQPPRKRKRRSAPAKSQLVDDTSYPSTNQPESSSATYAPLESPLPSSPDLDTLLQAEIARDESSGLEHVHQMGKKQKTQHHNSHDDVARPDRFVRESKAKEPHHNARITEDLVVTSPRDRDPHPKVWNVQPVAQQDWAGSIKDEQNPVIETLSKAKQRQIYGLISGLQGEIDHLQKQLNLLRTLLGIEFDHPAKVR